jgi:hypothetical protein
MRPLKLHFTTIAREGTRKERKIVSPWRSCMQGGKDYFGSTSVSSGLCDAEDQQQSLVRGF